MNENAKEAIVAVKALAEITKIFFDHLLELGTPADHAAAMTTAYIRAMLSPSGRKDEELDS